ncbi:interferon-induced very large GTPase 1-like [Gastrophryne carolinensis]
MKRESLLALPNEITLNSSQQQPLLEQKEFSSSEAESTFHKSMDKLGFSIAAAAEGGFWGFAFEASLGLKSSNVSKQMKESRTERTYISTTKYNYIPLASYYIPYDQLHLSIAALEELKSTEKLLDYCSKEDKPSMMERYKNFFSRFGSHANQGPIHFGGIFWWTALSQGFHQEMAEKIKEETAKVVNASVSASYGTFSGSVSTDFTKVDSKETQEEKKKLEKQIELHVTKTGGPANVDSLSDWKSGLEANNRTWAVIDRGFHLIPVWEIVLSAHKGDFKNVYQVATDLKKIYESMTGLHHNLPVGEKRSTAVNEANRFLSQLQYWQVEPIQDQLKRLLDFRQKLNEMSGNYNIWLNVCLPHKELVSFLERVLEFYSKYPRADESIVRGMLKCLLQNFASSSESMECYAPIIQWIYQSNSEQPLLNIDDFSYFINLMSQEINQFLEISSAVESDDDTREARTKFTVAIASYLQSYLRTLRDMEQKEEELLVLCVASCVGYSVENQYFQQSLGLHEVKFLVEKLLQLFTEYIKLKDDDVNRAQAFLLASGLTLGNEYRTRTPDQKWLFFNFMLKKIGSTLRPGIKSILEKHNDQCFSLQSLISDLSNLYMGHNEAIVNINTQDLVSQIKSVCEVTTQDVSIVTQPAISNEGDILYDQNVSSLFDRLGLAQHFPKGLTRRNFHVVHKSLQNLPSKESELPLRLMQMLMRLDYRFRHLICRDSYGASYSENGQNPDDVVSISDLDDDIFDLCSEEVDTSLVYNETKTIHPMDLLLAVYHCADDLMRQYIFTKLSVCQFALPFLVPRPYDSMIEIPLWAYRQVQKSLLDNDISEAITHKEKLISKVDFPVVCFTRYGPCSFSKSQLLNNLLNKHKHDIFFHRNCEGSVKNRVLVDGLAEIFWFCPSGKDTDQLERCTAFVNLRGDAREFSKQATYLQNIASVNVIIFSKDYGKEVPKEKLKEKPLIVISPDREASVNVHTEKKQVIIALKQNEARFLEELTVSLRRLLALSAKPSSLEVCAEVGKQYGFLVDEDSKECVEGKSCAQKLMSLIKQKDLSNAKEEFLPLSGKLWHEWCQRDKELTRLQNKMNQSVEQHFSDIEMRKQIIRKEQLEKASNNKFMKDFIAMLKSLSKTAKQFFLQWLKFYFDDLSGDHVMELRARYNRLWSPHQSEETDANDLITTQDSLESLSDQMNACMFGSEHVLREVGQTYEALHDLQYKDDCFQELPKIAADMMVSGYPIELMDGDACYVPLKWIKAVLGELIKTIGDKKIFVLSVLGVQSSGKSTLLNTMFGLQFAVSAGRCTRGAFMQLLEITDELKTDLDFDYILVIDTEGLRAMELSTKTTLNHDNELATFVIGVGNMTLINVFGENPSGIKDILQIAVQAFLRMKKVKLSASCLFVHQNVGDLTAREQNVEGRRNLQMELDKMTSLAAEQEQCNVQRFSEVIKFDAKNHIHYFAHLWEGNPPMAPPNPHYSEDAELVKELILSAKKKDPHGILTISKLIVRIEDLWSALRNENFVFSFKNTLEILAYSKVENQYRQLTWQLRRNFLELQTRLNNKIRKGEISNITQNGVEKEVREKFESIKEEFDIFFSNEKDKEILIQWKANTENRLNSLHTELVEETTRQAKEHLRLKQSQRHVQSRQIGYEEELLKKSKQLALDIKDEGLEESDLRNHFNILWQHWVAEIKASNPNTEKTNIIYDAQDVLLQYFKHEPNINDKLDKFSSWTLFHVDLSKHAKGKKGWFRRHSPDAADMKQISQVHSNIVVDLHDYLENKSIEKVDYNQSYFHEILHKAWETINIINNDKTRKFELTNSFKFDVSLCLLGTAVPRFESMHEIFQRANDPVVILERKHQEFLNSFTISCKGAASIKTFSDFLCMKILEAILPALYDKTALAIVDEMTCNYPAFSGNRSKLENYILLDLAEQEDFEKYREYIYFPDRFFRTFIEKCVNKYCLDKRAPKLRNFLQISLDYFQKQVLLSISNSTRSVKNKNGNVAEWLNVFYEKIEDFVTFSRADLRSIEHQEIHDIEFIQEAMCTSWDAAIENFQTSLETIKFDSFVKKPHEILFNQLCGCWEQCPFCKAICTNTIPGHDGDHSVPFHRSQAINGMLWENSNEFVTEICSTLVSSDSCLVIDNTNRIPYKHYRKIGPNYANWSITPDTSSQPYWKWYVCHFRAKLEEDYGLKFEGRGEIPSSWNIITKQEVIANLKDQL